MKRLVYNFLSSMVYGNDNTTNLNLIARSSRQLPYEIEIVAENIYVPWAIDISDSGDLYFTERSGALRVIRNGDLNPVPLITFPVPFLGGGEGGLMGIALDPNHLQNGYIYIMHSYEDGNAIYNRVVRLFEENDIAAVDEILIDRIPGGRIHNGGRIKIGPDEKLYVTTGDAGIPTLAQDPESTAGKILRINLDGSIPEDNPISNSLVYSLGHRNPQGLAWDLNNNILYSSEHGQIGHDEINIIKPGANYGWPLVQGDEDIEEIDIQKPLIHSGDDTWAPSGIAFVNEGPWQGKLLVTNLRGRQLLALSFNGKGTTVRNVEPWLKNYYGRLREVVLGKDGSIYISTSNRDGRGTPDATDDKIIKLTPKSLRRF